MYGCLFASPIGLLFALAPWSEVDLDIQVVNSAALQAWDGVCSNLGSPLFFCSLLLLFWFGVLRQSLTV